MVIMGRTIPDIKDISALRLAGLFLLAFGGIAGLLVLFTPFGCTVVGSGTLLICMFISIAGIIVLIASLLFQTSH